MQPLKIYNTLSRQKELFTPLNAPHVGMYVCGPTVYNYVHLGNVRTFMTFDVLNRYLTHLGYKVRYVRNITDVGHLVGDGDEGEDKIGKMAKLEQLEPMEIVQRYTNDFHKVLDQFNFIPPSIEPSATGHLIEQIEMTATLINKGLAYESNGSVYFDIAKYNEQGGDYGKLSGRILEDLLNETRNLDGVGEKRSPLDFALWKKAAPEHLMRWNSPWSEGFPGWHLECTCMSIKYLGDSFDIHGGGMDLKFPHHECEIAQAKGANGREPVRYWMHSNMLTVNGQKMSKSLGNSFLPAELFAGSHPLLEQAYSPMTVRFFMLQSQYRSTLDFSNEALQASEKGCARLMAAVKTLENLKTAPQSTSDIKALQISCYEAMNDDFNTPVLIAHLFEAARIINSVNDGKETITADDYTLLKDLMHRFIFDVLGLKTESSSADNDKLLNGVMEIILDIRKDIKSKKDFVASDKLRDDLSKINITIKDTKEGAMWASEN